jgi:hypothetical protein
MKNNLRIVFFTGLKNQFSYVTIEIIIRSTGVKTRLELEKIKEKNKMKHRSIGLMILLFLFTFGIYPIYWYIVFQSELKEKTGEGFGGFIHLVVTILTFGIYGIYWQYAAGKRLAKQGADDNSVLYLILGIFFAILNPFLMQSQANNL